MTVDFLAAAAGFLVGTFCGEAERDTDRAAAVVFLGVAFLAEAVLVFLVAVFLVTLARAGEWGDGRGARGVLTLDHGWEISLTGLWREGSEGCFLEWVRG